MPNWSSGTMKIRGLFCDVEKFINEGLNQYKYDSKTNSYVKAEKQHIDLYHDIFELPDNIGGYNGLNYFVEGTTRGFVGIGEYRTFIYPDDLTMGVALSYMQAWCIHSEELEEIANKYDLDIKVDTVECGMGFCEHFEKLRGSEGKYHQNTYDDWFWECPNPFNGG